MSSVSTYSRGSSARAGAEPGSAPLATPDSKSPINTTNRRITYARRVPRPAVRGRPESGAFRRSYQPQAIVPETSWVPLAPIASGEKDVCHLARRDEVHGVTVARGTFGQRFEELVHRMTQKSSGITGIHPVT